VATTYFRRQPWTCASAAITASICLKYGPICAARRLLPDYNPKPRYLLNPKKRQARKSFAVRGLWEKGELSNGFNGLLSALPTVVTTYFLRGTAHEVRTILGRRLLYLCSGPISSGIALSISGRCWGEAVRRANRSKAFSIASASRTDDGT